MGTNANNTKRYDFTSTNYDQFIDTPTAPPTSTAESYEIKPALLNLVMEKYFSVLIMSCFSFKQLC